MRMLGRATAFVRRFLDAVLIALILVVLFGVILGKVVPLTGRQTIIVGGGSMEPAVPIGAAIIVAPVAPPTLHVGDVVSLRAGKDRALLPPHRRGPPAGRRNLGPDEGRCERRSRPDAGPGEGHRGPRPARDPARRLPARAALDPGRGPVPRRPRRDPPRRRLAARVARARQDRPRPCRAAARPESRRRAGRADPRPALPVARNKRRVRPSVSPSPSSSRCLRRPASGAINGRPVRRSGPIRERLT